MRSQLLRQGWPRGALPSHWRVSAPLPSLLGVRQGCREFATSEEERDLLTAPPGFWGRFVHTAYRYFGSSLYPKHNNICNCGADLGLQIPKPELVTKVAQIERGSREFRMQLYGAALYWHLATMPGEKQRTADVDMIRGKDVLEVACMRGGGARYLAEVAGPRRYVATDNVQEHIETCRSFNSEYEGLEYEVADAMQLESCYEAETFDFVICVQAAAQFQCLRKFTEGVHHVLRPGGRLLLSDAFTRQKLTDVLDTIDELGMVVDAQTDLSREVNAVGLCAVPRGMNYLRLVARKPEK